MALALALSARGQGRTGANPNVGCVIVKDARVVGRGWTQPDGRPHAEAMALEQAGDAVAGATVYATLEPCAHDSARGPACASLVARSRAARLVYGARDPDPRTDGRGAARVRESDIAVTGGVLDSAARRAMAGFVTRIEQGRPFVTLKLALSLDGCVATGGGQSQWITGAPARAHVHLERARQDAILVGAGTLRADAPRLDVRLEGLEERAPLRASLGTAPVPEGWRRIGSPDRIAELDGVNWLLVEGGARTAASFLGVGLVDRLLLYRAPIVIGGGLPGVADYGLADLADAHGRWTLTDRRVFGDDSLEQYDRAA